MLNYQPGTRIKCPNCQTTVRLEAPSGSDWNGEALTAASPKYRVISTHSQCPECLKFVIAIKEFAVNPVTGGGATLLHSCTVWPVVTGREPVAPEVPPHVAQDYDEAAQVLAISAKASAALSRRCLQVVLREAAGTKSKDLADQIQEVMPTLPTRIAENLDAVRNIGNFAAHPIKSQATGTIVDVELGEAEWNLDVLDGLFDHYYVRPEVERRKRDALNKKLSDAGKPPLRTPPI